MFLSFIASFSFYLAFFILFLYYIFCFISKADQEYILFGTNYHKIFNGFINGLTITSFFFLILCFVYGDFNLYIVHTNSTKHECYIYRIGASWSTHEGSMLLWLVIMSSYAFFNSLFFNSKKIFNKITYHYICHFQCTFQILLYGIVFLIANPFKLTKFHASEGLGFNPLLQDYALLIHPPILYFGYAGTSILFAQILGFIYSKKTYEKDKFLNIEKSFYRNLKNWILVPLFFLTAGVYLGAAWSYRELGWGGFWAWDPVENVSLLPWLAGISALHLIFEKDHFSRIKSFFFQLNVSLIFILSIFATFVVRSGLINSLHSFAKNSERGVFFLCFLLFLTLLFIGSSIFYFKDDFLKKEIEQDQNQNQKSRLKYNFLFTAAVFTSALYLVIVFSILIPIYFFLQNGESMNINEKFFQLSFGLISVPILFLINLSYFFKDEFRKQFIKISIFQALISLFLAVLSYFIFHINFLASLNLSLAVLIFLNTIFDILKIIIKNKWMANYPKIISHFSFALLIFASIICTVFEKENETYLTAENNIIRIGEYSAELKKIKNIDNENVAAIEGEFEIWHKNQMLGKVFPELKFYKVEKMQLADSKNISRFFSDIYIVMSRLDESKKSILVKIYFKPLVKLIWVSGFLMAFSLLYGIFKNSATRILKKLFGI